MNEYVEIKSIFQLLNSLHVMVSTLMNPRTATDTDTIEVYVKFFLSCVNRSYHLVNGSGDYFWGKKGNFLSLLNLPDQIKRFGPIRWYWEGICEAYIQEVKPHLTQNLRKTPKYFMANLALIFKRKSDKLDQT